jgi:hypothetical protein
VTPTETLALAQQLLERADVKTAGLWPRAAALLARQALEQSLDSYWNAKGVALASVGTSPQLICLRAYLNDDPLAARVRHTWNALSQVCHHHPYELAPTVGELSLLLAGVRDLVAATASKAVP